MERELLFWSLCLVAFYLVFDRADINMGLAVKSLTPLSTALWWYATAYAIFLALLPFISKGLKAPGREYHLALAATSLAIWGLLSFIPTMNSIPSCTVFEFIYVFILISACKWYLQPPTTKQIWLLLAAGLGFFLLYTAASVVLSLLGHSVSIYITNSLTLPVIMIGFGMFPAVRPHHLPQPRHQSHRAIRVRGVSDHRLRRFRTIALGAPVQSERPVPAAIRNCADLRHPAGHLHRLHLAGLHPPGVVRRHYRPAARTLVRTAMEQGL